jgi:hypothetical protein
LLVVAGLNACSTPGGPDQTPSQPEPEPEPIPLQERDRTPAQRGFHQTLASETFSFDIDSDNHSSLNTLRITPHGLSVVNSVEQVDVDGTIVAADIDDLNADGFPEIYVFVASAGSGSYGSLVAYAVNNGKSMSPIYLPDLSVSDAVSAGYMGHDRFSLQPPHLLRRFPIYAPDDSNASPSGGIRTIRYELKAGEAGWQLEIAHWSDGEH